VKFVVTALAINPTTGEVVAGPREEVIDTATNELFGHCTGPWEVEDMYESFWNRLNDSWEKNFPSDKQKVKVVNVKAA
jgi:hypothetical protein